MKSVSRRQGANKGAQQAQRWQPVRNGGDQPKIGTVNPADIQQSDSFWDCGEMHPRIRLGEELFVGLVVEWRGYMGWIEPLTKIKHHQASKHNGRIYLNQRDVLQSNRNLRVKVGKIVDFKVYCDGDGLGAEECRPLQVLRVTLPHKKSKLKYTSQWSDYLPDSDFYPGFQFNHGILLRKYCWELPFALFELWGQPAELVNAAVNLVTDIEGTADLCYMRVLVPNSDVGKVDCDTLPPNSHLSQYTVLESPVQCNSLTLQCTKGECCKALMSHVLAVSS